MDNKIERQCEDNDKEDSEGKGHVIYGIEDNPPFYLLTIYALQQTIICISGTLSVPFLIASTICAAELPSVRAKLLSTSFFMCGLATIMQDIIGTRLPIIQGGSGTFIPPILAMMTLDKWKCPDQELVGLNTTEGDAAWMVRIREIQGNLILASVAQILVGGTGLIGYIVPLIGPLTIAPTIALIGLSLTGVVIQFSQFNWGIAFLTLCLVLLFCLFLEKVEVPFPVYTRYKGCRRQKIRIFFIAPILYAIGIAWLFCYIFTVTNIFSPNTQNVTNYARTDTHLQVLQDSPWFYFPYPFQFGVPTISGAGFVGMFAAVIASIIESVGDYYAAARISQVPPPPAHAVNRGILIEGVSSIISGLLGAGHATTSYSSCIGAIAVTGVASRRVFVTAGVFLVIVGVIGKIGAIVTLIPEPILGGLSAVLLGLVTSVGLSTLQYVDMSSARNLTILATSFMVGLCLPQWLSSQTLTLDTGSVELNQVIRVLLGTASFVGGIIGFMLDNLVPGTDEERGVIKWRIKEESDHFTDSQHDTYDLPLVGKYLAKIKCCSYVPCLPTYKPRLTGKCCSKSPNKKDNIHVYSHQVVIESERL